MKKLILTFLFAIALSFNITNAGYRGRSFGYGFAGGLLGGVITNVLMAQRYNSGYNYGPYQASAYQNYPTYNGYYSY